MYLEKNDTVLCMKNFSLTFNDLFVQIKTYIQSWNCSQPDRRMDRLTDQPTDS